MIGEYADGTLVECPVECPWRCAEAPCDVVRHATRARKAGPPHALAVCRCFAHDLSFTVYPPGFVPYARRALLDPPSNSGPADVPSLDAAARDAAAGRAWSRTAEHGTARWWTTQTRLLHRLGCALGAFAGTAAQEIVAVTLGLPLRLLVRVRDAVGYRARGLALAEALDALGPDLDRLLLAGALAGCWGPPWRWERSPPRLVPLVPAPLNDSAKPPTTSVPRFPPPFS